MTLSPVPAALMAEVFPEGEEAPTYSILDGARDDLIHDETVVSGNPFMLLFKGKLGPELSASAPRLVDLRHGDAFGEWVLQAGWGRSWGIFLRSTAPMKELRKHFRTFLKVKAEGGATMFFRYYDPRVLRLYLPTCTREELDFVFGPVDAYLLESADPGVLLSFRRDDTGALVRGEVRVAGDAPPAPATAPAPEAPPPAPAPEEPLPSPEELLLELRALRDRLTRAQQAEDDAEDRLTAEEACAYLEQLKVRLSVVEGEGYVELRAQVERAVKRIEFRQVNTRVLRAGVNALLVSLRAY